MTRAPANALTVSSPEQPQTQHIRTHTHIPLLCATYTVVLFTSDPPLFRQLRPQAATSDHSRGLLQLQPVSSCLSSLQQLSLQLRRSVVVPPEHDRVHTRRVARAGHARRGSEPGQISTHLPVAVSRKRSVEVGAGAQPPCVPRLRGELCDPRTTGPATRLERAAMPKEAEPAAAARSCCRDRDDSMAPPRPVKRSGNSWQRSSGSGSAAAACGGSARSPRASGAGEEQKQPAEACWICLEQASSKETLTRPCSCPRWCHRRCLARWQLHSAGRE